MHDKQGQEISKKLYRSISEQAKRLDDVRSCARTVGDLFTPNLQIQRRKLCEYCERLIFCDPVLYGRKGEELLWRKSFYDVVATAKKLKNGEYQPDDVANLQAHINSGIGFYHHFLLRLQIDFNFDLSQFIDFPYFPSISNKISDKDSDKSSNKENKLNNKDNDSQIVVNNENKISNLEIKLKNKDNEDLTGDKLKEWLHYSVHQCLIYLGDLSRYKLEIYPNWEPVLANRYYLQAISFRPEYGMPHNQMGTLAMNQNNYLDAVYHYLRCLACKFPFDGTVNNLHSQFDKNSKFIEQLPKEEENPDADCIVIPSKSDNVKKLIARFLLLIDIWYFNKKVSKVEHLCHQIYKNLEECLTYTKPTNSENGDCDSIETDNGIPYLTNDSLFKIVIISLLTISKMRASHSQNVSMATSFLLAIYSQLLQAVTNHIQEGVLNYPLSNEVKGRHTGGIIQDLLNKNKKKSLRRRKKIAKVSSEEEDSDEGSELSENEESEPAYESSSDDSFISDTEDILAASSEDDDDELKSKSSNSPIENGKCSPSVPSTSSTTEDVTQQDVISKVQRMDVNDMLEIITEEAPLQSIKILNDWLRQDAEVLKLCATNCSLLLQQITYLLNLINISLSNFKITGISLRISEIINNESKIPLSEDVVLKGVDILATVHKELDWAFVKKRCPTAREESVIRIVKLVSFGKFLMGMQETGISFDEEKSIFICKNTPKTETTVTENGINIEVNGKLHPEEGNNIKDKSKEENGGGQQLMKMKHMGQLWLAAEVKALENSVSRGKPSLSPYLVLDADALIKYTYMVKHLVNSRKFIVLVPTAVVSALDDLKREKSEARDAIRWLESQFHQGNRFFRAQRAHESAPIPFIKYPKKKDKEMHIYIKIIECCNFLTEQQKGASNLVTLLIGNQSLLSNGENKEFSYVGLAKSAGIAIESITQFYGKWKKSKGGSKR